LTQAHVTGVFGVSGVGKSTLLRRFTAIHLDFEYVSASALLKRATEKDDARLRDAPPDQIQRNQELLVREFSSFRQAIPHRHILLDAHSVIDGENGLTPVPLEIIRAFQPVRLIFVHDAPERIVGRRRADIRARPERTARFLSKYQQFSLSTCEAYAAELGIELITVEAGDLDAFSRAILGAIK
jgi:adenylate kinase